MMKVLLINHFPLEGSGSGTYTASIAHYLVKNGHETCIILPENTVPEQLPGQKLYPVYFRGATPLPGALPYNFPCFTTHPRSNLAYADLSDSEFALFLGAFDKAIADIMQNFKPDIIHAQHIWCLAYLATQYATPLVITTHGTDLLGYEKWPRFRSYADTAVTKCARLIAISQDNYQSALKTFPQAANKTVLLSGGYNESIFYVEPLNRAKLLSQYGVPYNGEQIVLFAGKLTAVKGVDTLLKAAQEYEALPQLNTITLIAGNGEKYQELQQLAAKLKLRSVYFLGHRNQQQLRQLYSNADIFVMPSRYEAFGLVAVEAMACGLPVIASRVGGLCDFVNSETGVLINADNAQALCGAVVQELSSARWNAQQKAQVAQYAYKNYAQANLIGELEQVYHDVCNS